MQKITFSDQLLKTGLFLYIIALIWFLLPIEIDNTDLFTAQFLLIYVSAVLYTIILLINFQWKFFRAFHRDQFKYHVLLLLLFNLSAYSLNEEMRVFKESVNWLIALLVLENIFLVSFIFIKKPGKIMKPIILVLSTVFFLYNTYQAFYITPLYLISIPGLLFFGISLHTFVPIYFILCFGQIIYRTITNKKQWIWPLSSLLAILFFISLFLFQWHNIDQSLNTAYNNVNNPFHKAQTKALPQWIQIAQSFDNGTFADTYLKTGIYYDAYRHGRSGDMGIGLFSGNQIKKHDPLIYFTTFILGSPEMDFTNRLKILNYSYDLRHETADRFWSGNHLKTSSVVTNVELFPEQRLSYTEMTLKIKHERKNNRGNRFQEEAIYTFQLPEGSAVSSLSLWIEGKEEKARLTTKSKSENAYSTIVGREMRDPSAVYWMEGNQVRVRVFPCTPAEDRQFKLGITSPLLFDNQKLIYNNITFKGPDFQDAAYAVHIGGNPDLSSVDLDLEKATDYLFHEGKYQQNWTLEMNAPKLIESAFSFKGNSYFLKEADVTPASFSKENFILAVDKTWTEQELSQVWKLLKDKKVSVLTYGEKFIPINSLQQLKDLQKPQFNLFPFYRLQHPENTVTIIKSQSPTPLLEDLKDSDFGSNIIQWVGKENPNILVLDIGKTTNEFLSSLKDLYVINHQNIKIDQLEEMLKSGTIPMYLEKPNTITLPSAGISITQDSTINSINKGNDHLQRLYAYHNLMKKSGSHYFDQDYLEENLIKEAEAAHIVTPFSSLIVLETLKDYERFDIEENKDSLGNAEINSSGAVPEPHEWALIIVTCVFVLVIIYKRRNEITLR